jgi:hypothetical protein
VVGRASTDFLHGVFNKDDYREMATADPLIDRANGHFASYLWLVAFCALNLSSTHSFTICSYVCIRKLVDILRGDEPPDVPGSQLDLARQACALAYQLLHLKKPEGPGCDGVEEKGKEGVVGNEASAGAADEGSDEGEEANDDLQMCARTLFVSVDAVTLCIADDPPPSVVRRSHKKKQHRVMDEELTEAPKAPETKRICTREARTRTNGSRLALAASKQKNVGTGGTFPR